MILRKSTKEIAVLPEPEHMRTVGQKCVDHSDDMNRIDIVGVTGVSMTTVGSIVFGTSDIDFSLLAYGLLGASLALPVLLAGPLAKKYQRNSKIRAIVGSSDYRLMRRRAQTMASPMMSGTRRKVIPLKEPTNGPQRFVCFDKNFITVVEPKSSDAMWDTAMDLVTKHYSL